MIQQAIEAPPPNDAHARLADRFQTTFLLESREGPERLARYSFLGFDPAGTIVCTRDGLRVDGGLPAPAKDQDPIDYLRRVQRFYHTDAHDRPFVGGLVGSIGYDFGRLIEPTLDAGANEDWPRFVFGLYLDGLVYDHVAGTATYVSRGADRSATLAEALASQPREKQVRLGRFTSDLDAAAFAKMVRRAQDEIRRGEAFQIVLSRAYTGDYQGSLMPVYAWLREAAAVPYLYHLRFGALGKQVLGASPECLVRVRDGVAETFPIAGTRPLTGDDAADDASGRELMKDRKETAEHAMLVDLARNDIGRVAAPGKVEVAAYQELHRFRTVQHIVSHVRAPLAKGEDCFSALAAVFPAGTVSGAPKVRAMEHIDQIETVPRGPYAGAVAYASFNGDFDSCIAIRGLSADQGHIRVQAGAGIVQHSDPAAEFQETQHKASTILGALEACGAEVVK